MRLRIVHLLGLFASLAALSACGPGSEEDEESLGDNTEALTGASFLLQHPLTGSAHLRTCSFNATTCAKPGWYHTGIDEATTGHPPIRSAGYGLRTLLQIRGPGDHGMGNAVGIAYLLSDGTQIYGIDSHMDSLYSASARPDGTYPVPRGTKLGTAGGTGYGAPTYSPQYDHYEMKTTNVVQNSCGAGTYYEYTPTGAPGYCYKNPDVYLGHKRVLIPEFSYSNSGWGNYDVLYGYANVPLYSRLSIESSPDPYDHVGVRGRLGWGATAADFALSGAKPAGSYDVTTWRTFSAGDYRFYASVQTNNITKLGYPVIFTVLSKPADFIRDNDMYPPYFTSSGLGSSRFDGYGYGAYAAAGNSGAWARWFTQRTGTYRLYVYIGGNGSGMVRYRIYPNSTSVAILSDPINLALNRYSWVQLRVGNTTAWNFNSTGYVGLLATGGSANDVVLFDAIKFIAQ